MSECGSSEVELSQSRALATFHGNGRACFRGAGAQPQNIRDLHASEHTGSFCTECCMEKNVLSERGNGL